MIPFNENKESASQETNGPNFSSFPHLLPDQNKNSLKVGEKVTNFKLSGFDRFEAQAWVTFSTRALNSAGSLTARSARTLRFSSILAFFNPFINWL